MKKESKHTMSVAFTYHTPASRCASSTAPTEQAQFAEDEWITAVRIYTEDLPKGVPTALFAPVLDRTNRKYAIRVEIEVGSDHIVLHGPTWTEHTLPNVVFQNGLPITIVREDAAYPGILTPLPPRRRNR